MSFLYRGRGHGRGDGTGDQGSRAEGIPGKRTLTEALVQGQHDGPAPAGQQRETGAPAAGSALPRLVLGKMEAAFGTDFSAVRIHEGARAPRAGALAYTTGHDIHFAPGRYDPASHAGQELLGHELAHVVQQREGRVSATGQAAGLAINDDEGLEREADELGARAARGEPAGTRAGTTALPGGAPVAQGYFTLDAKQARKLAKRGKKTRFIEQMPGEQENYLDEGGKLIARTLKRAALRISDDGLLAIQDVDIDAKTFFADGNKVVESNARLAEVNSKVRLQETGTTLTVPDLVGQPHELHQVLAQRAENDKLAGEAMLGKSQCIGMAEEVTGGLGAVSLGGVTRPPRPNTHNLGNSLAAYVTAYANAKRGQDAEELGRRASESANIVEGDKLQAPQFEVAIHKRSDREALTAAAQEHRDARGKEHIFQVDPFEIETKGSFSVRIGDKRPLAEAKEFIREQLTKRLYDQITDDGQREVVVTARADKAQAVWKKLLKLYRNNEFGNVERTKQVSDDQVRITVKGGVPEAELKRMSETRSGSVTKQLTVKQALGVLGDKLGKHIKKAKHRDVFHTYPAQFYRGDQAQEEYAEAIRKQPGPQTVAEKLELNEHAAPGVGGAFAIAPVGTPDEEGYVKDVATGEKKRPPAPYHWAGVVARSGGDVITLENYARGRGEDMGDHDPRSYFAMYGPLRQVSVDLEGKTLEEKETSIDKQREGSFHSKWKSIYPNAVTVAYGPKQADPEQD
jgi:hypothetical protein